MFQGVFENTKGVIKSRKLTMIKIQSPKAKGTKPTSNGPQNSQKKT